MRYDEGAGPPVVLLHGQPGSASDWLRVVPFLRDRGRRVIAVDRPGYAGSHVPPTDWRGNARLLLDRLEQIGPATLVGWSWGGGVALEVARQRPEAATRLVLVGSVGHETAIGPVDRLLAAPGIRRLMAPAMHLLAGRGAGFVSATSGSILDADALEFFRSEAAMWPATGAWEAAAVEQVTMVRDAAELSASLSEITTPATVVHGWRDGYVPIKAGAALAAALPNAELIPVKGGHLLPFEDPEGLADLIIGS